VATGQLAQTWYVAHIVLGLGAVVALGLVKDRPPAEALAWAGGLYALAVAVAVLWRRRSRYGPLEGLMRRLTG
jgi:uncharacterized membrane protein YeiB